jgi:hypothetical protein
MKLVSRMRETPIHQKNTAIKKSVEIRVNPWLKLFLLCVLASLASLALNLFLLRALRASVRESSFSSLKNHSAKTLSFSVPMCENIGFEDKPNDEEVNNIGRTHRFAPTGNLRISADKNSLEIKAD